MGEASWRTILHRADQFDIDKSEEWAAAFHFRVELGDGEAQRSAELKRASGEAGVNVDAEFDLKVVEGEDEEEQGLNLRVELWNSADDDEEVGFTQVKAQHTSMPEWLELHNDDGEFVCRIQLSMELQSTPVSQAAFDFEDQAEETSAAAAEPTRLLPSPSLVLGPAESSDAPPPATLLPSPSIVLGPAETTSAPSVGSGGGGEAIPSSPATDKEDDESEEDEQEEGASVLEEKAEDEAEPAVESHVTRCDSLSAITADGGADSPAAFAPSLVPARLPTTDRFSSEEWFTTMAKDPEWAHRPEMPGVYSFGPTEFVVAPSNAFLTGLLSDAEIPSAVGPGITIRCALSASVAAQLGVLVSFVPGNFEEDGINFAAQLNVCHPAAGTFRIALPGARTYDPSADSVSAKQAEAVDHKYALLIAAVCSAQVALLVNGGAAEDVRRIQTAMRPLLAAVRGGGEGAPALMGEWMSEQVICAVDRRRQAPSFGRYLEAKVRANGLDVRGPGYSHTRSYLVSLRNGTPRAPLSFVKALVQDDTSRKQMLADMPRKDFREVTTVASGTDGDSRLATIVLYLLRVLVVLLLVPSAFYFVVDINRVPFADGEQIAVGTVAASCHGLNDLVTVGLCQPHQLSLTSGGVLELRAVAADKDADAGAALVWSSAGTQKKKKNKPSEMYVAKRSGSTIAVFETKKKKNVVWEGALEEHPALAAKL